MSIQIMSPRTPIKPKGRLKGDPIRRYYNRKRDENNNSIYTLREEVNIQEDINSYRDGCSLEMQLLRMKLAPVDQVFSSLQQTEGGISADLTNMPNDLMDYMMMHKKLEKQIPDLNNKLKTMSFEDIVKSILPNVNKNDDSAAKAEEVSEEVNADGEAK